MSLLIACYSRSAHDSLWHKSSLVATVVSLFRAFPGATWGVKGALTAAGALGGLAGIANAVAVAKDNEKIRATGSRPSRAAGAF